MNSAERQHAIATVLIHRRHETMANLASEFGVARRTVVNDIAAITCSLPVQTARGNSGGVTLADWFRPHRSTLCPEQAAAIRKAAPLLTGEDRQALLSILYQFSVHPEAM